jgi:hypothetical protein
MKTTSAQRMRKMREEAHSRYFDGGDSDVLKSMSFSSLLELHNKAARLCNSDSECSRVKFAELTAELCRRLRVGAAGNGGQVGR